MKKDGGMDWKKTEQAAVNAAHVDGKITKSSQNGRTFTFQYQKLIIIGDVPY